MDSLRLKIKYLLSDNNFFFKEKISKKELYLEHITGHRYAWTNNNWRKQEQKRGLYVPKYWIEQDFINPDVFYFCIEFSVGKLLSGENITPVKENEFEQVISTLNQFLQKIEVYILASQIRNCIPTLVAVKQDINITDVCSASLALQTLNPFDYKPHSKHRRVRFSDYKNTGDEIIFTIKNTETFKFYDKTRELFNNAQTTEEKEIAQLIKTNNYRLEGCSASEILRAELTFKTKRKVQQRFKPFLNGKSPTFENIFKEDVWRELIKQEIQKVYDHPLKEIIFLAVQSQPTIDVFLDQNFKHIQLKNNVRGIITSLQEKGLAQTRKDYLESYRSRQTWYNYVKRLEKLAKQLDCSSLGNLTNIRIYSQILKKFGIETAYQTKLDLFPDNRLSKKRDIEPRNT